MALRCRVALVTLAVCLTGLFAVCGPASARVVHQFVSSFGSFTDVQGVATDAAGNVYVYDGPAEKIYKFDASGKPVNFTFTGTNAIAGVGFAAEDEGEIAVDNSSGPAKGDIYVAHAGSSIGIFSAAGEKIGELTEGGHPWGEACGVAVDSSGSVYVGLYPSHVNRYVPSANPVKNTDYAASMAGLSEVCNVAADSAGNLFADKWGNGPVKRYEPSQFGALSASGVAVDIRGSSLAVDPANQDVYVDEKGSISQFGAHGEPFEKPISVFGNGGEGAINGSIGIAVDPSNHNIYASDGQGKISVFGPPQELPTAATGEASAVTHTEATVAGTVDPEGLTIESCQFEYGTATSYGQTVPCPINPGAGSTQVEESVTLTGLEYGTEYHYRLVASSADGSSVGADRTFQTAVLWPESITGLPDGRVYEQVSPPNKYGNEVLPFERPAFVAPDGQGVMYPATGAVKGSTNSIVRTMVVSQRTAHGWVTRSAMPLPVAGRESQEEYVNFNTIPIWLLPSSDLSHLLFSTGTDYPFVGPPDESELANNLYLAGPDPSAEPEWVGRSQIEGAPGGAESTKLFSQLLVAGGSPDLKTVYFYYEGVLFPGASRLYEYRDGVLSDAGALPGGETTSGWAVAAAQAEQCVSFCKGHEYKGSTLFAAAGLNNQVSADGSRIFFVRQDEAGTLELYAHLTAPDGSQSTVLISQSQLAGSLDDPAPHGPVAMPNSEPLMQGGGSGALEGPHVRALARSYVFASPDGTRAFFESTDRLTEDAPADNSVKTYVFELGSGKLEYLPDVTGSIVTASDDGSSLLFENTAKTPLTLERWVAAPGGGHVTSIAQLPAPVEPPGGYGCGSVVCVGPAFGTADGAVTVFETESPIPGFNDGGTHRYYTLTEGEAGPQLPNTEVFRYEADGEKLSCLSCPPRGVKPASDAILSNTSEFLSDPTISGGVLGVSPGRAMSADGSRVFFATRDQLLPQDTNGVADVYEWEGGKHYLISTGHSALPSLLAGVSESADDVFFMTAEGIAPGDVDGGYDVYDARVPRPGDNPPPEALPCTGSVCQGPPSVPQLLGQPASEAFNGAGNLSPAPSGNVGAKGLTRAQKLQRALKACHRYRSAGKRKRCIKQARTKYGAKASRTHGAVGGHYNRRGK